MFQLTEDELESLSTPYASVSLALFGVTAGIASSALFALIADGLSDDARATCIAVLLASGCLTIYFAMGALFDWRKARRRIERIKRDDHNEPYTNHG